MAVDHIWFEREGPSDTQGCVGKKSEALQVIVVITPGVSVEIGSIVHIISFNQVNRNIVGRPGLQYICCELFCPQGDFQVVQQWPRFKISFADKTIKGEDKTNICP